GGFSSSGVVTPLRAQDGGIEGLLGQLALENVSLAQSEFLAAPVAFPSGKAAARVQFEPFRVDLGEATLRDGASRASVSGRFTPRAQSWDVVLDASVYQLPMERALPLWPSAVIPGVRRWVEGHVEAGRIAQMDLHLRRTSGETRTGLEMRLADGAMRVLPDLPVVEGIEAVAQYGAGRFDLTMTQGAAQVTPDQRLDLAGSQFSIADARAKPAVAEVALEVAGPVTGALALIDRKPLNLLSKAGQDAGIARGWTTGQVALKFPLLKGLTPAQVETDVAMVVEGVTSDRIVPGRRLAAEALELTASNTTLSVRGPMRLDGVPMEVSFAQGFGPEAGPAQIRGALDVTPERLADLGISLPPGSLTGQGRATFELSPRAGEPTRFVTDLSLAGIGLSIPALEWEKPADAAGTLRLEGRTTEPVSLDRVALAAPELALDGRVVLAADGSAITSAAFERFALGGWLDAPLIWSRTAEGDEIEISGGRIDLR
ncbi:MAG: hypothetical protein AAF245_10945, partial [Pseudomonadota bacterium]